jgi:sterol desaturase/sphingolipid hydroxylase (fatty acid hydroxylase superfamily)
MRTLISYVLWPALMLAAIIGNAYAMHTAVPMFWLNVNYFSLAGVLLLLERVMPHEKAWLASDGQLGPDIGHTLLSKASVQTLIVAPAAMGAASISDLSPATWWPSEWPMALQVLLALACAECGFYVAHRLGHEWPLLWRFHAVHHSVTRLWLVNTGRFHFVDTLVKVLFGVAIALAIGAPKDIIVWVSAITGFIGFLTHANVEMRCGPLNYVFNTPDLHRWHHSMIVEEGNRNYGENLVFMDQLFGTYFYPAGRRPPVEIGVRDPIPATLGQQILYPFRTPGDPAPGTPSAMP